MDATALSGTRRRPRWWRQLAVAARRGNLFGLLEIAAVITFVAMTLLTWVTLSSQSDNTKLVPTDTAATLLIGTLVPAMGVLILLGRRLALRRSEENAAGTGQLHVKLVFQFSMIAAAPTLLVVIFASFLFQSGNEFWFSDSSKGLLENANKLARGYYEQTQRDVEYESLAMAGDMQVIMSAVPTTSPEFGRELSNQVLVRKLGNAAILQKRADGRLHTAAITDPQVAGDPENQPIEYVRRLEAGEPMVLTASADKIETLTPIDLRSGLYLYASRRSDLLGYGQSQRADNIVRAYEMLTQRARVFQLRFNVALFVASLALVALAIWFALRSADRLVKPLYDLVGAARQVGEGNYSMRIEQRTGADEVGLLNRAFNRMTTQLDEQRQDLVGANWQLNERRAFIEAVLESVTAGVISVDSSGAIRLMNSSAQKLLFNRLRAHAGRKLASLAPQFAALVEGGEASGIVQVSRGTELLTFAVRISADRGGHVITFEDITRQLLDQRQAAWSDVARRIAHEIKNPLTPIQLATERLSRRYRKEIASDPELFEELTSTIVRQVGELRKMVDEFSSFARLPKPVFRFEDAVDLARQALFLQEVAHTEIVYEFGANPKIGPISCDRHQFGQAMTNVLKNAGEAVEARAKGAEPDYRGRIRLEMAEEGKDLVVTVTDNGVGLPQDRERIAEPYVTTRDKGTGLGLAIVKKIVEEHGGDIAFSPADGGGAKVMMRFARDPLRTAAEAAE
jgi:two-component system nitrogen regulation sensor histidine kinase NtrY